MIRKKYKTLSTSKGPQFRKKGGVFFAFLSVGLIILSIGMISSGIYFIPSLGILFSLALILYTLDIHGIEIDPTGYRIRDYQIYLGFRTGRWEHITDYGHVYLTRGRLTISTTEYVEHESDTYYYFFVKLVDEFNHKEIMLAEYRDYKKAKDLARKVASSLRIELEIRVREVERL